MGNLGSTVRALRVERDMSQSQLAKAADVARSYVSMIESGARTNVGTDTLARLAAALGLSAGAILGRAGIAHQSAAPIGLSLEARRLAERIDALPPGAHERALALAESLVRALHDAHEERSAVEPSQRLPVG
jgi:transcriptional regulator with XRE-family HTH domain